MDSTSIEIEDIPLLQRESLSYFCDPNRSESEESDPPQARASINPKKKLNLEILKVCIEISKNVSLQFLFYSRKSFSHF